MEARSPCAGGCGFYGNESTMGLCSKCFREQQGGKAPAKPIAEGKTSVLRALLPTKSGAVIQVRLGDMTTEAVDCIVNAANSSLDHASGLAGALSRKGGPRIQAESDEWVAKHGRLEEGQAAVTTAGLLPARHLLHAVGPTWRGGQQGESALLQMAVRSCLTQANTLKCVSISLPAISSGIFGYPKPTCAHDMFNIVLQYLDEEPHTTLREIRFTNFDEQTVACFEEECKKRAKP